MEDDNQSDPIDAAHMQAADINETIMGLEAQLDYWKKRCVMLNARCRQTEAELREHLEDENADGEAKASPKKKTARPR